MLKIPSTIFDKKNLSSSRTETKRGRKKKKKLPSVLSSVLSKKKKSHKGNWPSIYSKTCRDHGPGLGTKERKTMQKKRDPHKEK